MGKTSYRIGQFITVDGVEYEITQISHLGQFMVLYDDDSGKEYEVSLSSTMSIADQIREEVSL